MNNNTVQKQTQLTYVCIWFSFTSYISKVSFGVQCLISIQKLTINIDKRGTKTERKTPPQKSREHTTAAVRKHIHLRSQPYPCAHETMRRRSPPLSILLAAVLQSDKGEQRLAADVTAAPSGPTLNPRIVLQTIKNNYEEHYIIIWIFDTITTTKSKDGHDRYYKMQGL